MKREKEQEELIYGNRSEDKGDPWGKEHKESYPDFLIWLPGHARFVIIHWAVHLWSEPPFSVHIIVNKDGRVVGWDTAAGTH